VGYVRRLRLDIAERQKHPNQKQQKRETIAPYHEHDFFYNGYFNAI
jgi:hypothetical protein